MLLDVALAATTGTVTIIIVAGLAFVLGFLAGAAFYSDTHPVPGDEK